MAKEKRDAGGVVSFAVLCRRRTFHTFERRFFILSSLSDAGVVSFVAQCYFTGEEIVARILNTLFILLCFVDTLSLIVIDKRKPFREFEEHLQKNEDKLEEFNLN